MSLIGAVVLGMTTGFCADQATTLPGTASLTATGDLSTAMVAGIDRWLMRETERVSTERAARWERGLSAEERSAIRGRLREMIGAVDPVVSNARLEVIRPFNASSEIVTRMTNGRVLNVRWRVLEGLEAEGLLLEPAGPPIATVICLPDADQTPESLAGLTPGVPLPSQFARHLVQSGWRVLVPVMISRDDAASGNDRLKRFTNQPHREWIYRQAFELERHVIGYEVQKVLAAVQALSTSNSPIAVAGYGEGGLIALHAAALEPRIGAALVSGYFGPRERLWQEPIYRNLFGFVREFGDAEVAALVQGGVIVEHSTPPQIKGPPPARAGRTGAAPGVITTAEFGDVEAEVDRATALRRGRSRVEIVHGSEGSRVDFGSRKSLALLARALRVSDNLSTADTPLPSLAITPAELSNRQHRAVRDMEGWTQELLRRSESVRHERFWRRLADTNAFLAQVWEAREVFRTNVMGQISGTNAAPNPRTRLIHDKPAWTGYEVMLDVRPDVFAWGILLVPKNLKPGERRPVVVCQHGLEGLPEDTIVDDPKTEGFKYYQGFAARLAERGFVVYAPHNPYRGRDQFRVLQRKANPLGLSLFSFIIAQHEVTTEWLASLSFVDAERIGFYGLSYGGKTAMRVPAVVERYCLSICSGDFNEWVLKNVTTDSGYSYMFTGEYEMPEWNLGHTFNYAEMAALIAPRPFMVERGHDDGVAPDSWVAYEYAKVRRMYGKLGHPEKTQIEFFDGPHRINGVGTFEFLHKHLGWKSEGQSPKSE